MAIYRTIQLSFWTDIKVVDDFTPEDKYFYLYLFSNPQTNMCGCYEASVKTMSDQLGYTKETVERLLERFENYHEVIKYSKKTKEILILNWYKYNWQGGKQKVCLAKEIQSVKNKEMREILVNLFNEKFEDSDTPCIPLAYPLQANCLEATVTVTDTVTDSVSDSVIDIVSYLNNRCNTNYKSNTSNTKKHISARLREGYTLDDFYTVIDKKADEWMGTDMEKFLRPDTLFASKFESYLNQRVTVKTEDEKRTDYLERWANA